MINGKQLRDAFISGSNNLFNKKSEVDALNVFPVPDGDTGTNMSMTIGNGAKALAELPDDVTVGEVSKVAAGRLPSRRKRKLRRYSFPSFPRFFQRA